MIIQLASSLPCETMKNQSTSCNRPATTGLLRVVETLGFCGYTMQPICSHCITTLATAAGQEHAPQSDTISAVTIKQVLAARLGLEGAEEVLCALRTAGNEDNDDEGD